MISNFIRFLKWSLIMVASLLSLAVLVIGGFWWKYRSFVDTPRLSIPEAISNQYPLAANVNPFIGTGGVPWTCAYGDGRHSLMQRGSSGFLRAKITLSVSWMSSSLTRIWKSAIGIPDLTIGMALNRIFTPLICLILPIDRISPKNGCVGSWITNTPIDTMGWTEMMMPVHSPPGTSLVHWGFIP